MHSFFFGRSDRKLYGSYSPPMAGGGERPPLLLCYPFGQEQTRAHLAFRQLANLISRAGAGVLRFDYFGTGDSAGDLEGASFPIWVEDARLAMDELKALSGSKLVSVAGLRLGAAVAAYAADGNRDVRGLALWDPVVEGASFLDELAALRSGEFGGAWWVNGFPVAERFRASLEGVDLRQVQPASSADRVVILSEASRKVGLRKGSEWPQDDGWRKIETSDPGDWNYMDDVGGILVPREAIRAIVQWVTGLA